MRQAPPHLRIAHLSILGPLSNRLWHPAEAIIPILQIFCKNHAPCISGLTLEFGDCAETCHLVIESVVQILENLAYLEVRNEFPEFWLRSAVAVILDKAPLCASFAFTHGCASWSNYEAGFSYVDSQATEDVRDLFDVLPEGKIGTISIATPLPSALSDQLFSVSTIQFLQSLRLDPFDIGGVCEALAQAGPTNVNIQDLAVYSFTRSTYDQLDDEEDLLIDPRKRLPELLSYCPALRHLEVILPFGFVHSSNTELDAPFEFEALPNRNMSLHVTIENHPRVHFAAVQQALLGLRDWIARIDNLAACSFDLRFEWEDELERYISEDVLRARLSAEEIRSIAGEVVAMYPQEALRYPWDECSEVEIPDDAEFLGREAMDDMYERLFARAVVDWRRACIEAHQEVEDIFYNREAPLHFSSDIRDLPRVRDPSAGLQKM